MHVALLDLRIFPSGDAALQDAATLTYDAYNTILDDACLPGSVARTWRAPTAEAGAAST